MLWGRTILDGLMAAFAFNAILIPFAMANPRWMLFCYPKEIQSASPPTKRERSMGYRAVYGTYLAVALFQSVSMAMAMQQFRFWPVVLSGYIQWMMINFAHLCFFDWLAMLRGGRGMAHWFIIKELEVHAIYEAGPWMRKFALPEHLISWPVFICPIMALLQTGIVWLVMKL